MGIEPTYELLHSQQGFEDLYAHQYISASMIIHLLLYVK